MSQPKLLDGRYRVVQKLSEGGFGVTYLACDTRRPGEPRCVAKELRHEHQNNPKIIQLFHQEAEMLERLGKHDQIPQLLASFHEANRLYLVQEYIDGVTVYDELLSPSGKRRKTEAEVIALLQDVLTALAFVHQHQVVHRDIKPANLMRRKRDGKVMLIDFGAVKALTHSQIQSNGQITTTVSIGSPGYSPHEQISQGNPRPASDIYALGMTAIEALTGVYPTQLWTDPSTAELAWQDHAQVSPPLAAFLTQMVRHHFSRRFQNAGVALTELAAITAPPTSVETVQSLRPVQSVGLRSAPQPTLAVGSASKDKSRRELLKFLGFSVAGVAVTLGGQRLLQGEGDRSDSITSSDSVGDSLQGELAAEEVPAEANVVSTSDADPEPVEPVSTGPTLEIVNFQTVKVNAQGQIIEEPSGSAQYFDEPYLLGKLGDALPLRMVQIPGGEFMMGSSPESEPERGEDEGPQRSVTVPSFFLGAFTITQRQYQEIMEESPSRFTDNGANRPVEQVSWEDAVAFCEKLSEQTDADYRLPSEAEWEYACRARTTTPFAFGETLTTNIANYDGNRTYGTGPKGVYRETTVAVNDFSPNAFGLYNMHGNVYEWCQDDWHDSYNGVPGDSSPWLPGDANTKKVLRGGSWGDFPRFCRSADRGWDTRAFGHYYVGFRVACRLPA